MTLAELLRWHRQQVRETDGDLRELHRGAVQLLTGVLKQRAAHREAIVEGLARAREEGRPTGGRARIDPKTEARVRKMLVEGASARAIQTETGCGASAVYRIKAEMDEVGGQ